MTTTETRRPSWQLLIDALGREADPIRRRNLEVVVSVRGGRTRITVQENLAPLIGQIFGGIGGGMGGGGMGPIIGILVGVLHLPAAAIGAIIPLWLGTTYVTARTAYHAGGKRRIRELAGLADRLAALAREIIPDRPAVRLTP